jgi:hypothetical protein
MEECKEAITQKETIKETISHYIRKWFYGALLWMYLNIWCRHCYRHVMRLMHNFNLHHTTEVSVIEASSDYKDYFVKKHLHCQWCGLRGDILKNKYYSR